MSSREGDRYSKDMKINSGTKIFLLVQLQMTVLSGNANVGKEVKNALATSSYISIFLRTQASRLVLAANCQPSKLKVWWGLRLQPTQKFPT